MNKFLIPNIALTAMLIMTERQEGEWEGGAQCDIKYLIPNNKLTKYSV